MRQHKQRSLSPFGAGLLAIIVLIAASYLAVTKSLPFSHHYTLKAAFANANDVKKGSFVRIAGVNVGKVVRVQALPTPGARGGALVTMRMDDSGLPVHADAQAKVRPRIFLEGNFFIDLSPGSPSARVLRDGDTIPVQNNSSPVQLDQILTSLQADTRRNLQIVLREYSQALFGPGGQGFDQSLRYQPSAYKNTAIVNDALLGQNPGDLQGYIDTAGTTAAALNRSPSALQNLITDFNTTAHAFAVSQSSLTQTIADLPVTLHAALPALAALNAAFPPLRRLVVDFRPAVRSSGPALTASVPFARALRGLVSKPELRGLVADLRPTVPALAALNNATIPLLQQTRALSSCQNRVILPFSHEKVPDPNFPAKGDVAQESTKTLSGLAGETRSGDANGFWFRVLLNAGTYTYQIKPASFVQTAFPILGVNPPKSQVRPPLRPDVPCETQQAPSLNTHVGPAPQQVATSMSTPAAQRMYQDARAGAIAELRKELAAQGKHTAVSNQDITPAQITQLAAQAGHLDQLSAVPALLRAKARGR